MEIALDSHDTILAKNKDRTKSYKNGRWWPVWLGGGMGGGKKYEASMLLPGKVDFYCL